MRWHTCRNYSSTITVADVIDLISFALSLFSTLRVERPPRPIEHHASRQDGPYRCRNSELHRASLDLSNMWLRSYSKRMAEAAAA